LINQWVNVVRWEMRPRIFLRTTEFLWQEGHTAHATEKEAVTETFKMLEVYRAFAEETLAMPVITGEKTPGERFPGAVNTYCIEALMQDRKALQSGTTHYLGQNFSRVFEIQFSDQNGDLEHAYTTSWGVSTRLVGALIMVHGDDDGLRLPPKIAPKQVIVVPMLNKPGHEDQILAYARSVAEDIGNQSYDRSPIRVKVDERDIRPVDKKWEWIKKGAPIRLEIGFRDLEADSVFMSRRDRPIKEAQSVSRQNIVADVTSALPEIQDNYFDQARALLDKHTYRNIGDFEAFTAFFTPENLEKPEIHGGFVRAKWCENPACEQKAADIKVTIRCLPFDQSESEGKCVICGSAAKTDAVFAKAY